MVENAVCVDDLGVIAINEIYKMAIRFYLAFSEIFPSGSQHCST
jgi:hypothetical protein